MSLVANISRRMLLLAGAAAFVRAMAMPAYAWSPFNRGGVPRPQLGADQLLHIFSVQEVNGVASKALFQAGLPLGPTWVMPGETLEVRRVDGITVVPAQFDGRSSYRFTNEGLKLVIVTVADPTDFTANELRTYKVFKKSGTFNNSAATTLAAALVGHDYNVDFANITGAVSGALSPITANLATHAAIASRVDQRQTGPYKNTWEIWGETSHPQLIVVWHYSQIRDAAGNFVSDEMTVEPAMWWWDVGGKENLVYDAALRDGATSLVSYTGVTHNPQTSWVMVRTQNDNLHARPVWNGATIPSLLYIPDKEAWRNSGMIPRYDTSIVLSYPINASTYIPGRPGDHRYAPSGTGAWMAEGLNPNSDVMAFGPTTAINVRKMLVNACAGMHYALNNCRSAEIVTKPGKTADKANTICPQIMSDGRGPPPATPLSYYDFTSDGMPASKNYYMRPGFGTSGWVEPPAGSNVQPDGTWERNVDCSHAPNYAQFAYLYTGYRFYLNSVISNCAHQIEQQASTQYTGFSPITFWAPGATPELALYPGASSTRWEATAALARGVGFTRAGARAIMNTSCGLLIPDGEVQTRYIDAYFAHQVKYLKESLDLIPPTANGMWSVSYPAERGAQSGFMNAYLNLMTYFAYDLSRLADIKAVAEYVAQFAIQFAASNHVGQASSYRHNSVANINTVPDDVTNPFFTLTQGFRVAVENASVTGDIVTNGITSAIPYTDGDIVVFPAYNDTGTAQILPAEVTALQVYYAVNTTASTFKFSATPGGSPIVTSAAGRVIDMQAYKQASGDPTKWIGAKNPSDYGLYWRAAFMAARYHNHPLASTLYRDRYQAMYGAFPIGSTPWQAYETM